VVFDPRVLIGVGRGIDIPPNIGVVLVISVILVGRSASIALCIAWEGGAFVTTCKAVATADYFDDEQRLSKVLPDCKVALQATICLLSSLSLLLNWLSVLAPAPSSFLPGSQRFFGVSFSELSRHTQNNHGEMVCFLRLQGNRRELISDQHVYLDPIAQQ